MTMENKPDMPDTIKNVMIGGNHLASALLATADPAPYRNLGYYHVLEKHGQPYADMFVAWKAIMDLRDAPAERDGVDVETIWYGVANLKTGYNSTSITNAEVINDRRRVIDYLISQGYLQPQPRVEGISLTKAEAENLQQIMETPSEPNEALKRGAQRHSELLQAQSGDDAKAEAGDDKQSA